MGKKQKPSPTKQCASCGQNFRPDARVRARQRFCGRPECRRASRRLSQAQWLNRPENQDYHSGVEQVQRVNAWRQANPDYRRLQRRRQKLRRALGRVLSPALASALISCGLQDLNDRQLALILGLSKRLLGVGLQDEMARALREAMFDGYALLRAVDSA